MMLKFTVAVWLGLLGGLIAGAPGPITTDKPAGVGIEAPATPRGVGEGACYKISWDGKDLATLTRTSDNGAGLWIEGPEKKLIAIFSVRGQTGIGLYGKDRTKPMPICLSVDDNDEPYIQIRKGDKVVHLDFADLASIKKK